MLLCPSALLLSQPFVIVISSAEFVLKWFLVLVTLWVNLYKQGFRGVKGEKGEPGQPGLDGLDAPCQLVQYFSFLPPCMQFLCLLRIHLYQCKVVLLEQALHDTHYMHVHEQLLQQLCRVERASTRICWCLQINFLTLFSQLTQMPCLCSGEY